MQRQINRADCSLRTFQPFRMIMRDLCDRLRHCYGLLQRFRCPCAGAYSHCGTVAKTVVWQRIVRKDPAAKASPIACPRVLPPQRLHTGNRLRTETFNIALAVQECLCNGQRHDAVIRRTAAIRKKLKLLAFDIIPLKAGPDDIAYNCSQHYSLSCLL